MSTKAAPAVPRDLQRKLWKHAGKWVAIDKGRIVATGQTPAIVIARASKKGSKNPLIHHVLDPKSHHLL